MASPRWPFDTLQLGHFPPVEYSIGYGSGVFRQEGYSKSSQPMIDLVLVIRDSDVSSWHQENLKRHPQHYAGSLRCLGVPAISRLQHWGPGLFFHPYVRLPCTGGGELEVKYGVISDKALLQDLNEWTFLYMAGRMHKPCVFERQSVGDDNWTDFMSAVDRNRLSAFSAALLLGSCEEPAASVTVVDFLRAIVRLSYEGDVRLGLAENPKKVENIVTAQREKLWQMYAPLALKLGVDLYGTDSASDAPGEAARLDFSSLGRERLLAGLPAKVQSSLEAQRLEALRNHLRRVVWRSSLQQSAKGVLCAGPARSVRYLVQKLRKRF